MRSIIISPNKTLKSSSGSIFVILLLIGIFLSPAFCKAHAQQGGDATGGAATGGDANSGTASCYGNTCHYYYYGGSATGGQATGGLAVNPSDTQNSGENVQPLVEITKSSANSYRIVNETAYIKTYFDTSYIISGSSNLLNNSSDIITSTVINDFLSSPTVGYILQQNNPSNSTADAANVLSTITNPFVDQETIRTAIEQQLSEAINTAIEINYFEVDIKCTFGEQIQDWDCVAYSLPT